MAYADDHVATCNPNAPLNIVTKKGATEGTPYSRNENGGMVEADFDKTGRMYLVPNPAQRRRHSSAQRGGLINRLAPVELT